jgi:glucokinase
MLTVDLGGTYLRSAPFARETGLGRQQSVTHGASTNDPLAIAWLVEALREQIRQMASATGDPVTALGISIAGLIDPASGRVRRAENLGWDDVDLVEPLSTALGVTVSLDTDTFCGARAEATVGGATDGATVLYIAVGTGIGHAWIVDRRVWRGDSGAANLFGHVVVDTGGPPCYCGRRGCLCQFSAGQGIADRYGEQFVDLRSASISARAEDIVEAAARGDTAAHSVLTTATDALALAIGNACTLMNPSRVILAGGAISDCWPERSRLRERIKAFTHDAIGCPDLVESTLGTMSHLVGAGTMAWERERGGDNE